MRLAALSLGLFAFDVALCGQPKLSPVPFVGCAVVGQHNLDPPKGAAQLLPIARTSADRLAWYASAQLGVLAPRGWYCLGLIGSSGDTLLVSPQPIHKSKIDSLQGPGIHLARKSGQAFGRIAIAELISRVFPAYERFIEGVENGDGRPAELPRGPYPSDRLEYLSNKHLRFLTPPVTDGLGTHSLLTKDDAPIEGAAMLLGELPDVDAVYIAIRLPTELRHLASIIITEFDGRAAHKP